LRQISDENKKQEKVKAEALKAENADSPTTSGRRSFLKKAALGGIALGGFINMSVEDSLAHATSKVQRTSAPSELKITDMRYALTAAMGVLQLFVLIQIRVFMAWVRSEMALIRVMRLY